jgi:septum formation protein
LAVPSILLASSSPRRRELLLASGFQFTSVVPCVAEKFDRHFSAGELTTLNATRKGMAVACAYPDEIVLAADTLVTIDGKVIGKPANLNEATKILRRLSGRVHQVCSAVFVGHMTRRKVKVFCDISRVRFRRLSDSAIANYLAKIDPLDKAGAYAAQGHGSEIIADIQGSYSNVVGLPMERTIAILKQFGVEPRGVS